MAAIKKSLLCLTLLACFATQSAGAAAQGSSHTNWFAGGDISALAKLEALGAGFKTADGKTDDAMRIMRAAGANCFRLRLFVEPNGRDIVVNDLPYTLALAQRIKQSGASLMLDFHYSDTWADPAHQTVPKSWEHLTGGKLADKVEEYTAETLKAFAQARVFPEFVQVGNEVSHGMLWPQGKLSGPNAGGWPQLAELLKAGSRGVRKATPSGSRARIIMHSASGGLLPQTRSFVSKLREFGVDYDVLGLSYYPWWHGTLDTLGKDLQQVALDFGKEVMVVETGFPWRAPHPSSKVNQGIKAFPATRQGQADFMRKLIAVVAAAPEGRGIGVLWWYPESIKVPGVGSYFNGDTALFDADGKALPAMRCLAER